MKAKLIIISVAITTLIVMLFSTGIITIKNTQIANASNDAISYNVNVSESVITKDIDFNSMMNDQIGMQVSMNEKKAN